MILCSTGALIGRPNGRDYRLLKECVKKLICGGLEFMMYDTWYGEIPEVVKTLKSLDKPISAVHLEKSIGELSGKREYDEALRRFSVNCDIAKEIGADLLVLHLWNGTVSDNNIENNFYIYPYFADIAQKNGLMLTVENVVCSKYDPLSHMKELASRYPDIKFTFDTKMAEFHKQTEDIFKEENRDIAERIAHLHINDYGGGYKEWENLKTLHPGEGGVDFARFFDFVKRSGYSGNYTLEATSFDENGVIHTDLMNESIKKIEKMLKN